MKVKRIHILIIFIVAAIIIQLFMSNIYKPKVILKTAVTKSELVDEKYILCKVVRVTGFNWLCIQNEFGEEASELIGIVDIANTVIQFCGDHLPSLSADVSSMRSGNASDGLCSFTFRIKSVH